MIISHKYKFIFIKTGKTAGTSLEVFLSKICGPDDIITPIFPHVEGHEARNYRGWYNPLHEIWETRGKGVKKLGKNLLKNPKFYNHIPAISVKNRINQDIWNSYTKFCIERNPWDRTVSHFHMVNARRGGEMTFDDYLNNKLYHFNYPKYLHPVTDELLVDKVILYEDLNLGLKHLFGSLKIPFSGKLNEKAKTTYRKEKRDYKEYYDEKRFSLIETEFRKEIELWNFTF